jgi:hypothetical protein
LWVEAVSFDVGLAMVFLDHGEPVHAVDRVGKRQ